MRISKTLSSGFLHSDLFTLVVAELLLAVDFDFVAIDLVATDCRLLDALSKSLALLLSSKFEARTLRLPFLALISGKLSRCFDRIDWSFERRSEPRNLDSDVVGGADVIDVDDVSIFLD